MRLIDADRLETVMSETIMVIIRNPKMENQEAHIRAAFATFEKMIHNAPIIDAVSAVRCKDCKHSKRDDFCNCRWCQKPGSIKVVKDEFFCADGERKDT